MVLSALGTAVLLSLDLSIPQIFLVVALLNLAVAVYITRLLPGALVTGHCRLAAADVLPGRGHRVEAPARGRRAGAHRRQSPVLSGPALIAAYVPEDLTFAIDTFVAKDRMLKYFLSLARTIPIDPTNPLSTRALIEAIRRGEKVVIFPEGRITVTGSLMQVFEGPGMVADKAGARIVPVRLEGAQYSPFSRLRGKVRIRWFPRIRVAFQPPRAVATAAAAQPRAPQLRRPPAVGPDDRHDVREQRLPQDPVPLPARCQGDPRRRLTGCSKTSSATRQSYRSTLVGSFALGRAMAAQTASGEHVGLLLPNAVATVLAFFGLQAHGRVPAMLNFSTGARAMVGGCQAAEVTDRLQLPALHRTGQAAGDSDCRHRGGGDAPALPGRPEAGYRRGGQAAGAGRRPGATPGVSFQLQGPGPGESGCHPLHLRYRRQPQGVVLSHTNLQANRYQVSSMIDFGPRDTVFNVLPLFHSFGLTCGTLLPILSGLKIFLYPSPLHYRIVPEMVYHTSATLLFGTETFLAGYARYANPYDFYSIRYVFTGAERLK